MARSHWRAVAGTTPPTWDTVGSQWDRLAPIRSRQLAESRDHSFAHILLPALRDLCTGADTSAVLDVGCGVGALADALARTGSYTGVDLSAVSIELARNHTRRAARFVVTPVERLHGRSQYSLIVAHLTIQTVANLPRFLAALRRLSEDDGRIVLTTLHPYSWPHYWEYGREPWFRYSEETVVQAPFKIRGAATDIMATHIHRPLSLYLEYFSAAGFSLQRLVEPQDPAEPDAPSRFMGFQLRKVLGHGLRSGVSPQTSDSSALDGPRPISLDA